MSNEDKQIDHGDMIANIMMRDIIETITVETVVTFTDKDVQKVTTDESGVLREFYISTGGGRTNIGQINTTMQVDIETTYKETGDEQ